MYIYIYIKLKQLKWSKNKAEITKYNYQMKDLYKKRLQTNLGQNT